MFDGAGIGHCCCYFLINFLDWSVLALTQILVLRTWEEEGEAAVLVRRFRVLPEVMVVGL